MTRTISVTIRREEQRRGPLGPELGAVQVHPQPEPPRPAGRLHLAALSGPQAREPQGDKGTLDSMMDQIVF